MHLFNIMNQLEVETKDRDKVIAHFKDRNVSVAAVRKYVEELQLAEKEN